MARHCTPADGHATRQSMCGPQSLARPRAPAYDRQQQQTTITMKDDQLRFRIPRPCMPTFGSRRCPSLRQKGADMKCHERDHFTVGGREPDQFRRYSSLSPLLRVRWGATAPLPRSFFYHRLPRCRLLCMLSRSITREGAEGLSSHPGLHSPWTAWDTSALSRASPSVTRAGRHPQTGFHRQAAQHTDKNR